MSTSEYRSLSADGGPPISEAELAALAGQLLAASFRPGPDTPPQSVPVAPRGNVPDLTAATSAGTAAVGTADPVTPPAPLVPVAGTGVPAPSSPGPEFTPPQTVPVAPRGNAPGLSAATSTGTATLPHNAGVTVPASSTPGLEPTAPQTIPAASRNQAPGTTAPTSTGDPFLPAGVSDFSSFAVPTGIVPTTPGVIAGSSAAAPPAPKAAAPTWPTAAPGVTEVDWAREPSAAPDYVGPGDESNFYFLSSRGLSGGSAPAATPLSNVVIPRIPDDHEVFDVHTLRADFPILRETVNGKPLIWFDNAATTQKPQSVIDRISYFYEHENSNIHRAAHELAARATDAYEEARETVRRFINAPRAEQVIFVRGTTEAINLVAASWGRKHLGPGDEIVITHLEHHANIVPWQVLTQQTGAVLKVAPVDDAGNLLLGEFEQLLGPRTKLVAATQVSNALGTVTPVHKIVELGHRYGARVLIDGAQSIPHIPTDVQTLGADFFVFSGHKIFGPTGIGVLYGTEEAFAETPPYQLGGNMIADVTLERAIYQGLPNKFEAGTGNIADAVGLGEALRYVEGVGIERIAAYEHSLLEYATPLLADIPGVRLVGTAAEKASVLSFVLAGHDTLEVGKALNTEGIAVRAGHHCAQPILRRMGLETTVRPSFAFYNTYDEIDVFIRAVRRIAEGGV